MTALDFPLRRFLSLLVLRCLFPLRCLLPLNRWGHCVNGQVPRGRGNALEGIGFSRVAGHDESLGRNAAAVSDNVAMLDVPGLLSSQLYLFAAVQANFQATLIVGRVTVAKSPARTFTSLSFRVMRMRSPWEMACRSGR